MNQLHQITPETIPEGRKSNIFLGGMPPDPLTGVLCVHTGTLRFNILDPPLGLLAHAVRNQLEGLSKGS